MAGQVQVRNSELVDLLSADFQLRYEPNFAWKSVCSQYQALPGLRGFWPMSSFDSGGDAQDQSGYPRELDNSGYAEYGYDQLVPYVYFDGSNDWLHRSTEGQYQIIGTETYVQAAYRGLTMGGWFKFDVVAGGRQGIFLKYENDGNGSYGIYKTNAAATVEGFVIDGGAETSSGAIAVAVDTWYFIAMRFDPSTEVKLWVDEDTSTAAGPADIDNSSADITIGAEHGGANKMTGYASLCFLSCMMLSDTIVWSLWQQSRAMFNK